MKKQVKAVLALTLAIMMMLLAAACGASTQTPTGSSGSPATTAGATTGANTSASGTYNGATINLLADNRAEFTKMLQLYPDFEKQTGIKLNFIQLEETPLRSKTGMELAAASTDIDVVMMDFTFVAKYSKAGYLQPLDDLLAKEPTFKKDDFMKSFIDGCSFENKLYAVPINQDCSIMTYRADIFKELNLDVPKTFDQLEDVCKKIKAAHPEMSAIAMRGARGAGLNEWTWPTFLWGFGGQYYDPTSYKAVLNSPESVKSLDYYANLLKNYGPAGVANYSYVEVQTDMAQGKTAIMIDSATLSPRCEDASYSKVAGKLSYAKVPGLPGKEQPGFYAWTLAIPKHSKNQEAAAKFVAWLSSPDIASKVGWSAPNQALKAVYSIPKYADYAQSQSLYDVMLESLAVANPDFRPRLEVGTEISTRVSEAVSSVLAGETDAKTALEAANKDVDQILKDGGYQK